MCRDTAHARLARADPHLVLWLGARCCLALVLALLQAGAVCGQAAAPAAAPSPGTVGQGLGTWAAVLANVLVNRVRAEHACSVVDCATR